MQFLTQHCQSGVCPNRPDVSAFAGARFTRWLQVPWPPNPAVQHSWQIYPAGLGQRRHDRMWCISAGWLRAAEMLRERTCAGATHPAAAAWALDTGRGLGASVGNGSARRTLRHCSKANVQALHRGTTARLGGQGARAVGRGTWPLHRAIAPSHHTGPSHWAAVLGRGIWPAYFE